MTASSRARLPPRGILDESDLLQPRLRHRAVGVDREGRQDYTIPANTVIPSKGYAIVGRNATKAWTKVAASSATPGTGGLTGCGKGVFINEFSDAIGTGNYVYEFVEIFSDK
jgi:hypothetical protein